MAKIATFINPELINSIKELYKDSDKSFSKIISELIDIGYKVKLHQNTQQQPDLQEERKAQLKDNHTEYLLRIMAIASDVLRCIRNEKSKYSEEKIDDVFNTITANTRNFIKKKLDNQ